MKVKLLIVKNTDKNCSKIAKRLYEDKYFYQECSEQTKELFDYLYSEAAWLEDFKKVNKEFNNGYRYKRFK